MDENICVHALLLTPSLCLTPKLYVIILYCRINHAPIMACNCNDLLFFVWLLIVKPDTHLLPWWVCSYSSLHTIVSWLVNRKIIEFYITKKRQRNQRSNCQHPWDHRKSKRVPKKHLLLLYWPHQSLWLCGSQQTGNFFKRWEYQTTLTASWEICVQVKKQQLEPDVEQQTGSKLGKEYVKAVYCHPAYLTSLQSCCCCLVTKSCPTLLWPHGL